MFPPTNTSNQAAFVVRCPPVAESDDAPEHRSKSSGFTDLYDLVPLDSPHVEAYFPDLGPSMRQWLTRMAQQDPDAPCHAMRVACLADRVAIQMSENHRNDHPARRALFLAGLLHDVGKLHIPSSLLNKPGPLTYGERALVRTHAIIGEGLLQPDARLRHIARIVRAHHERWDGAGYPDGLRGEQISWQARVIAVCDSVSAMSSDRPYRASLPLPFVINEVRLCSGTQFDPCVAEAAIHILQATANAPISRP